MGGGAGTPVVPPDVELPEIPTGGAGGPPVDPVVVPLVVPDVVVGAEVLPPPPPHPERLHATATNAANGRNR